MNGVFSLTRDDRPVHLLGIGGVRDVFHGVRQGIDTFDCVHPTRLARHGSALVTAQVWDELPCEDLRVTSLIIPNMKRINDKARTVCLAAFRGKLATMPNKDYALRLSDKMLQKYFESDFSALMKTTVATMLIEHEVTVKRRATVRRIPRDAFRITSTSMAADMRPVDSSCTCYTCKRHSRAYLHHLFAQSEILASTLVGPSRTLFEKRVVCMHMFFVHIF